MMNYERKSGILLHPTSLPGKYGIGTLGKEAYEFIDFLIKTGQKIWQTCPLGPTGYGDSPYQCFSAFAGNPLLIDLETFVTEELLSEKEIVPPQFSEERVDFGDVINWKFPILHKAHERFVAVGCQVEQAKFFRFCEMNSGWLDDYAMFMSCKDEFGGKPWSLWEDALRFRKPEAMTQYKKKLSHTIEFYKFIQYAFFKQWKALKAYANANYISIIGDIPLYVSFDSSDAWASPELFLFDKNNEPVKVAGVPPDYFSATGQLWGNPIYNWELMKANGFRWWTKRIKANLEISDIVRFDHFRGLCAYWAVPYGDKTAVNGSWVTAPGDALFTALEAELGKIPLIAEDLGVITSDVVALREKFNLPGMKILQFAFDSAEASSKNFIPHVYDKNCVVYTGTHDNDTVTGWYQKANAVDKQYAEEYLAIDPTVPHKAFIKGAWSSTAVFAIAPMQDLLGLGSVSRMNTPGTASGNWQWRYKKEQITDEIAEFLRKITTIYNR